MKKAIKSVFLFLFGITVFISAFLYRFAVARKLYILPIRKPKRKMTEHIRQRKARYKSGELWINSHSFEKRTIKSFDNLNLTGKYLEYPHSKRTIILCHGFRGSDKGDFAGIVPFLYDTMKMNILMITQRTHGESEGSHICYGIKERYDVCDWANLIAKENQGCEIFLYGVSMGASTVMMSTGTNLPSNIKGLICDCGYTCAYDIFARVIKNKFHLPAIPFVPLASLYAKIFAKYGFKDCSATECLKHNHIPVLFIHGTDDDFVPPYMSDENFAACAGEKYLIKISRAGHADSVYTDYPQYTAALKKFIDDHSV